MRAPMVTPDGQARPCGAELATMILGVVAQVIGTICIVAVVALVVGCSDPSTELLAAGGICYRFCEDSSRPPVSRREDCPAGTTCRTTLPPGMATFDSCHTPETCQQTTAVANSAAPCGGYELGQACITDANLAECRRLVDAGCSEDRLLAMESCPLQFGCSDPLPAGPSPPGAAGQDSSGASVSSAGAPPTVSSVSMGSTSASGGICSAQRESDWVLTKFLGVLGGLLLASATPFLSCQTHGCAGCGGDPQAQGVARGAWALFGLCVLGFVVCGTLGIGFRVEVPIGWAVVLALTFNIAFALMCTARHRSGSSRVAAGPEGTPMIVVAAAVQPSQPSQPAAPDGKAAGGS